MKPDLIILHGALGCKEQFTEWARELSVNCNCYLMDFSGHGTKSAEGVNFSIELFSKDLQNYIEQNNLVKPYLLGYSMGGYVALYTALQNERLVGDIMTLATKFDWNPETSKKEAGYLKPELMLQKVPQLVDQLKQRHGDQWEKVVEKTARMMIALGEKPLLTHQNISKVNNYVEFCVGDKDKMVSLAETEAMYKAASNAGFCTLTNTGHLPETMNIDTVFTAVTHFLFPSEEERGLKQ